MATNIDYSNSVALADAGIWQRPEPTLREIARALADLLQRGDERALYWFRVWHLVDLPQWKREQLEQDAAWIANPRRRRRR